MHPRIRLGGHLPGAEGLAHIVVNARALGYNVIQTMIGDDRSYDPQVFADKDTAEYRKMMYGIETIVHLPYMINPCEPIPSRRNWYRRSFRAFCVTASELGARAVVIHPGKKKELPEKEAMTNLLKFFEAAFDEVWNLDILLETDSGSKNGSAVGSIEFITDALRSMSHPRFAMAIDTEHLYARGLDLWDPENLEVILEKYQHEIRLVHLNVPDPGVELGSFRDRHNSPFESKNWNHKPLIETLLKLYPCVLERSSISVQEQDARYVRGLLPDLFSVEVV